jgi:para-aminobenzoate synthetase component I
VKEITSAFKQQLNEWGEQKIPFFFMIDFEMMKPLAFKLSEIDPAIIKYNLQGFTNVKLNKEATCLGGLTVFANPYSEYEKKFNLVFEQLKYGYSFLVNLTDKTRIESESSLEDLFAISNARYKLLFKDEFLVFSPESFIQVKENKIFSFPMKGTIDSTIPNAKEKILNDPKELAEHVTIVDLIRNDLSEVASNVTVKRFRYVEEIQTQGKNLLQVSSEIVGDLTSDYASRIGDLITSLLPAGSVSGAPKAKTLEIIKTAEKENRGYYTGVFGYFDGVIMDSGVMIRFIERRGDKLFYRSGGGITTQSNANSEYQELIDKVYVPID